jgi:hypothetical protein
VFELVSTQVSLQQVPLQQSEPFPQPVSPVGMQPTHVFVVVSQTWPAWQQVSLQQA